MRSSGSLELSPHLWHSLVCEALARQIILHLFPSPTGGNSHQETITHLSTATAYCTKFKIWHLFLPPLPRVTFIDIMQWREGSTILALLSLLVQSRRDSQDNLHWNCSFVLCQVLKSVGSLFHGCKRGALNLLWQYLLLRVKCGHALQQFRSRCHPTTHENYLPVPLRSSPSTALAVCLGESFCLWNTKYRSRATRKRNLNIEVLSTSFHIQGCSVDRERGYQTW